MRAKRNTSKWNLCLRENCWSRSKWNELKYLLAKNSNYLFVSECDFKADVYKLKYTLKYGIEHVAQCSKVSLSLTGTLFCYILLHNCYVMKIEQKILTNNSCLQSVTFSNYQRSQNTKAVSCR